MRAPTMALQATLATVLLVAGLSCGGKNKKPKPDDPPLGPTAKVDPMGVGKGLARSSATNAQRPAAPKLPAVTVPTRRHRLEGHELAVEDLAFSPDGQSLASGSTDKTVRVWTVATGKSRRTFAGHEEWVTSVAWHPRDQLVLSGSGDKKWRLWRVNRKTDPRIVPDHNGLHAVAFSRDGKHLVTGGFGGGLRLWHTGMGDWRRSYKGHETDVLSLAVSADGKLLASGGADSSVRLWTFATAKALRTLSGHSDWVLALAFAPDRQHLWSVSRDLSLRRWKTSDGSAQGNTPLPGPAVKAAAFGPAGGRVAVASGQVVHLLATKDGRSLGKLPPFGQSINAVALGPQGLLLAVGLASGHIELWQLPPAPAN